MVRFRDPVDHILSVGLGPSALVSAPLLKYVEGDTLDQAPVFRLRLYVV